MALFDNIGKKLAQTGQEAVAKTKSVAETVKLNSAISDIEKLIGVNITRIGQMYYEKFSAGGWDSEFDDMFIVINEAKSQIEEYEKQLRQLRGVVLCKSCGTELAEGMAFCGQCGERLPLVQVEEPEPEAEPRDVVICKGCGTELEAEAAFCTSCGEKREQI